MNPITALYIAGGGATARYILLGGGPNKGVGPAIAEIRRQFAATIPTGRAGYELARNVVRRVITQINAAERVRQAGPQVVPRLPRDPSILNTPGINYSYRTVVEFQSRITGRTYRTVTTVLTDKRLSNAEAIDIAAQQVREDVNYAD